MRMSNVTLTLPSPVARPVVPSVSVTDTTEDVTLGEVGEDTDAKMFEDHFVLHSVLPGTASGADVPVDAEDRDDALVPARTQPLVMSGVCTVRCSEGAVPRMRPDVTACTICTLLWTVSRLERRRVPVALTVAEEDDATSDATRRRFAASSADNGVSLDADATDEANDTNVDAELSVGVVSVMPEAMPPKTDATADVAAGSTTLI